MSPASSAHQGSDVYIVPLHEAPDDGNAAAFELQIEFLRRVAGARQYYGKSRNAARRAAHDWYVAALAELNDRMRLSKSRIRQNVAQRRFIRNADRPRP